MDKFLIRKSSTPQDSSPTQERRSDYNSTPDSSKRSCVDLNNLPSDPVLQDKIEHQTLLNAMVDCIRFILRQGFLFCDQDEYLDSSDREIFFELLQLLAEYNESIKKVLHNTPKINKLTCHDIQKDLVNAAACETTNAILKDLDNEFFSILVDVLRDISQEDQMTVVLRYVDKKGIVTERFLGIVPVADTTVLSLKAAIESLFCKHELSLSRLCGQGYDGTSFMQDEFNGLQALILRENKSAFYVHCFAHQLHSTLVAVAQKHIIISELFYWVAKLVKVVGDFCERLDACPDAQLAKITKELDMGELRSWQGLNQKSSHYKIILNLIVRFSSTLDVLEIIEEDGIDCDEKAEAQYILNQIPSFEFAFALHLMKNILGITNELSIALLEKNQDIVNAMTLVKVSKQRLQMMRDDEWESLLIEVSSFCSKHDIPIPNMDEIFVVWRSQRKTPPITTLHHYRVDLFYKVIDMQLQELNIRFSEENTELLLCMACLNPSNSFFAFDKQKLIRLAKFYPSDFCGTDFMALDIQLQNYIVDVRCNDDFLELEGIGDLARKMVETQKDAIYPLVYLLVKLVLTLPVATATVERSSSAMKYVKNQLHNQMGDQQMNDCLVTYIESDVFNNIDNEAIIQRFQNMKT
jgi:hypothetical protein